MISDVVIQRHKMYPISRTKFATMGNKMLRSRQQISCWDDPSRPMETEQEIFQGGLYARENGVVALP